MLQIDCSLCRGCKAPRLPHPQRLCSPTADYSASPLVVVYLLRHSTPAWNVIPCFYVNDCVVTGQYRFQMCIYKVWNLKNCNHKPQEERDVRTCVLPTDKLKFGGLGGDIPHMEDHDIPSGPYKSNHTNHIF